MDRVERVANWMSAVVSEADKMGIDICISGVDTRTQAALMVGKFNEPVQSGAAIMGMLANLEIANLRGELDGDLKVAHIIMKTAYERFFANVKDISTFLGSMTALSEGNIEAGKVALDKMSEHSSDYGIKSVEITNSSGIKTSDKVDMLDYELTFDVKKGDHIYVIDINPYDRDGKGDLLAEGIVTERLPYIVVDQIQIPEDTTLFGIVIDNVEYYNSDFTGFYKRKSK
jgi:hypothetical protein